MKYFFIQISSLALPPLRIVLFIFVIPPLFATIFLFYSIDKQPITDNHWSVNSIDIRKAKRIIAHNATHQPKTIHLNEKTINQTLSYLLNYYTHIRSNILIKKDRLQFKIAIMLNNNLFGKYLNFSFNLTKQQGYPVINAFKIGQIQIADEFAGILLESIIKYTPLKDYYILASQHIRDIQISPNRLTINYLATDDLDLKNKLNLSHKSYQSVLFYQMHLSHIVAEHNPKWRLSLSDLLQPLFTLAYQRSTTENSISENRAVLIAVSTYVNKNEIQAFLPFQLAPKTQKNYPAFLYRRTDMAKHFMISAVLAATGAETLAHILGQEKELNDAKQGSGFSFIDLAGDRAGLRFGKTAIASPGTARQLQKRMFKSKDYTDFMPEVRDLPENMNHTTFKRRFESVYSVKYQDMLKKIDRRIDRLMIYQP